MSLALLGFHVQGRVAYLIGDIVILIAWICFLASCSPRPRSKFAPAFVPQAEAPGAESFFKKHGRKILAMAAVCMTILMLWSVRLGYTGPAYDGVRNIDVVDERIRLPIFSDEWLMSGLALKSIEKRTLPLFDPLKREFEHRDNFLAPLISGISGLSISAGIDPVKSYWIFVFAFQALFASVFYFFLRTFRLSMPAAVLGTMSLICLPESNLSPGIWVMLPAYVGLVFMLAAFALIQAEWPDAHSSIRMRRSGVAANLVLASLIYPPYFILIAAYLFMTNRKSPERLAWFAAIVAGGIFFLIKSTGMQFGWNTVMPLAETVGRMVMHERFASSTAAIWKLIPVAFFVAATMGYVTILKKTDLSANHKKLIGIGIPAFGILALCTYVFDKEILLSHQRTVFIAWLLMIVPVCAFVDRFARVVARGRAYPRAGAIAMLALIGGQAALLAFGAYQGIPPWRGVTATVDAIIGPIASRPIMLRMLPDGYAKQISLLPNMRFIADPYVSLAIGATTGLEPVSATASFMGITGPTLADLKKKKTCEEKMAFADEHGISFVIMHVSDQFLAGCDPRGPRSGLRADIDLGDRYSLYQI